MLNRLQYEVTFSSTGRTLKEDITFKKGFGTITGRNEAGKSFVIEMVRYVLFGSAALRSVMSDYQRLKGKLSFSVMDKTYLLERNKTNATLADSTGKILATGTAPVNAKVVEVLGFGLPVFDIACVANQGDLERLGEMKPTERKRLVDSVLGLGVIDDLAKWAGEESRQAKRAAVDAERFLSKPDEVELVPGYQPPKVLEPLLDEKSEAHHEILRLSGRLVDYPCPTPLTIAELQQKSDDQRELQALIAQLNRLPEPPTLTEAQLIQFEQEWQQYEEWLSIPKISQPDWTTDQLDELERRVIDRQGWQAKEALETRIRQLESHQLECPACQHRWSEDDEVLKKQKEKLAQYSHLTSEPEKSPLTLSEIEMNRQMLALWEQHQGRQQVEVKRPELSKQEIREAYMALGYEAERTRLAGEIAGRTPDPTDYQALIINLQKWQESEEAKARIAELQPTAEGVNELRQLLESCRLYDKLRLSYEQAMSRYQKQLQDIQDLRDEADQWTKVQTALVTLRAKVKQFFVPSLNRVASHFIQQMTGGERQRIVVDEEFNIEVDGQGLHTLSGSGKAVANLAIRLGLGQVLTNNIFSLFVGDEIDASMDKNRADNTSRVLDTLKSRIYQILLVTHKYPTADYYIHVGDNLNDRPSESPTGGA